MGQFKAGQEKPKNSGRSKGTPNLKTLVLRESLSRVGFDIVQELNDLYPILDPQTKAKVLLSFLPLLFPRPEPVEATSLRTAEMQNRAGLFKLNANLDGISESDENDIEDGNGDLDSENTG